MKYKKILMLLEPGKNFRFFRREYVGETFTKTTLVDNGRICCIRLNNGFPMWISSIKKVIPV